MDVATFFKKAKPGDKARVDADAFKQLLEEHTALLEEVKSLQVTKPAVSDLFSRNKNTFTSKYLMPDDLRSLAYNKDVVTTAGELRDLCEAYHKANDENIKLRAEVSSYKRELSKLNVVLSTTAQLLEDATENVGIGKVYDVTIQKGVHYDSRA